MARNRAFDPVVVIDAAVEQFWTTSYGTTSTEDLCETSRLSRSSLYNTFGSKRELYIASLQRYVERKQEQRAVLLASDLSGREQLRTLCLAVLDEQWDDASRRACLGINASIEVGPSDPQIAALLERNAADFDDAVAATVRRGAVDGSLTTEASPRALGRSIHALLDGLQVRSRITSDRAAIVADLDTLLSLL